ncbi:MAG TPA: CoA-binding protein [Acidiferrobacterales bacterium]|nr:CoA-binding protein [Acidiferrobacterales bacterium]
MAFANPSQEEIRALLIRVRTIAVVGLSPNTDRPSYRVALALQGFGYRIIPVHPMAKEILGEKVYPDLATVPEHIDLVDVFRAPDQVDEVIDACIALQVPAVWLQDGVVNEAAAQRARAAGLMVIMDRCVYRDYVQLFGAAPRFAP